MASLDSGGSVPPSVRMMSMPSGARGALASQACRSLSLDFAGVGTERPPH
jgi:hypothetical protein